MARIVQNGSLSEKRHAAEPRLARTTNKEIQMHTGRRLMLIATIASATSVASVAPAWSATGSLTAAPNPCRIAPGAHDCTAFLAWSGKGVRHARVLVRVEGARPGPEKEFATGPACAKCGARWIEAGPRYIFTLVDFSSGIRGADLASVTVTGVNDGARLPKGSGAITAVPNPCRLQPGKTNCATSLKWTTEGIENARVYVTAEGRKAAAEKPFGTDRDCGQCSAGWIAAGTRYLFTLYDFSTGSRGRPLASVVVSAIQ